MTNGAIGKVGMVPAAGRASDSADAVPGVSPSAADAAGKAGALSFDLGARYGLAFSGGCDSSYLLAEMVAAGVDVKAYMVKTAFQAAFEVEDARRVVAETGAEFELIEADVLSHGEICANPQDRCYLCKRFIFGTVLDHMARDGRAVLVDGTNASDDPSRRPGFRALDELGVVSPLREAGLAKEEVRVRSRAIGLSTADKPNFSCYATKVPEGVRITQEELDRVAHGLGHIASGHDEARCGETERGGAVRIEAGRGETECGGMEATGRIEAGQGAANAEATGQGAAKTSAAV